MVDPDWIEHRRAGDGERLGWIVPRGEDFVAIDLLGREITAAADWFHAEQALDELGLGYLAEPFELRLGDGHWLRVRISEVSPDGIRVKKEDWGDMTATQVDYPVAFPAPADALRPFVPGE